ncbi:MAG: hypothetical protein Q4F66_09710, partial [Clostridium sp.]|nr:hypothetical protein [Clostridium sp.]
KKPGENSSNGGGMSKAESTFSLTGETKTIDLNKDYTINIASGSKTVEGSIDDITIGSILKITYDDSDNISEILVNSNNTTYTGGSQTGKIELTGENIVDSDSKSFGNDTLECSLSDSAVLLSKDYGNAEINNCTLSKSGDTTSNDESNFYGINSGVVAANGGKITIKDCTINTDSDGSNGIFSTGDGSYIKADNIVINTTKNSSRGLDATYNGTIIAENPIITTQGEHCAALATDRGEGTIHVNGGVMKTAGSGSPGIYSTGKITAKNASFTATGSQGAVIEGKNSITVTDCDIVGYKNNGAMLYQSFSGDSGVGTSYFNMTGGTFTAMEGPMFYVTNTDAEVNLNSASLDAKSGILINCAIGRWGKEGSNGGNLKLNAYNQILNGDVMCDNISSVNMNLENECSFTGAVNSDNTGKETKLYLDDDSTWNVTKTSYLTVIKDINDTFSNIIDNGNTIYYDSSNSENYYLEGKTITLSGGGILTPLENNQ